MFKIARGVLAILLIAGSANVAMAQGASKLHTVKNSVKYKNTGAKPATGRSGSASLEARVLIAKNNTMVMEAATNSVESTTNPGTITKMQVKVGADFTRNYNGLNAGGFWTASLPAATRHTQVQFQGNIKGIDPKRNDVVTVTAGAMLRPDIAVLAVNGAPQEKPNTPVTFFATVKEMNGDVGARANCVFSVNGTTTATIPGIWIDANGTVSCQFSHTFAQPGTYTVGASATGVNPADWDLANNSGTTTITIITPDTKISNGSMQAYQDNYEYRYEWSRSGGYYCQYGYSYYCSQSQLDLQSQRISNIYMNGWGRGLADLTQRIEAKISTNGNLTEAVTLLPSSTYSYNDGYYQQNCADFYGQGYYDGNKWIYPGFWANMCSNGAQGDPNNAQSSYSFQRVKGEVVYRSIRTECDSYGNCWTNDNYNYYWNNYQYGDGQDFNWQNNDTIRLELKYVSVSGGEHTLDKSVQITGYSEFYQDGPYDTWDEWNGSYHYLYKRSRDWFAGYINWNDQE